ncbi:ASCH domain-containing protein [Lysobacter korlensis]|uniref:ASCH domain-containing protein n=1 Tax=Lysobacter korlensis TaxID=553636 RepID=A0ABV6S0U4_9GAMM
MWREFLALRALPGDEHPTISHWHFCDNQPDADECARLVLAGKKRATAPSLWSFEVHGEPLPEVGDLHVITNWAGEAQCIIRVAGVEVVPLNEITEEHARAEGEGDGSLAWWRAAHWSYYHRELEGSGYSPEPDMPIIFERFEVVHPPCAAPGTAGALGRSGHAA